jgi:hypothetical protein
MDKLSDVNRLWTSLGRRADLAADRSQLEASYVPPLHERVSLSTVETSVVFGRRGMGKTHALLHLERDRRDAGDAVVLVDMRLLGSNAGIYDHPEVAFSVRATRLLVDLIETMHETLYVAALAEGEQGLAGRLHVLGPALDQLANAATEIRVSGTISLTEEASGSEVTRRSLSASGEITGRRAGGRLEAGRGRETTREARLQVSRQGTAEYHIHLGTLSKAVRAVCTALGERRLWILIDEWAEIPYELQPTLADLLRRTFFTCSGVTTKITAIEHRSSFRAARPDKSSYIGIELGSDTGETLNLDDSQGIKSSASDAETFMTALLALHFESMAEATGVGGHLDRQQLLEDSFAPGALQTLVLASEGNPRDALNLVAKAAREAQDRLIGTREVLSAAHDYFWNTKYKNIEGQRKLERLFADIMQNSLTRGKRTFLVVRGDAKQALYHKLYDERLIHIVRTGVRPASASGQTYDGYAIDFGSYADRILSGVLRWANDGWTSAGNFFNDADAPGWRTGVMPRGRSSDPPTG